MKQTQEWMPWSPEAQVRYTLRRIERACPRNHRVLQEFSAWLARDRGLAPATITVRVGSTCEFVDAVTARAESFGTRALLRSLTPETVEGFFVRYGKDHGIAARRSMSTAIRTFLRFAASRGWVGWELTEAVPSLRGYRLSNLPRGLSTVELSVLLSTPWEGARCPRRNRAIVYLLATYGIRRQQVADLKLQDIDWCERTIDFAAHKGGKAIHQALTPCVAEALADYLRNERPHDASDSVFLRHPAPHLPLSPLAISSMVRLRMARCGLAPRGPHALRHAFATRVLQAGQPVKVIADLLGHRSLHTVAVYAKVDFARLLEVAIEWPEVAP